MLLSVSFRTKGGVTMAQSSIKKNFIYQMVYEVLVIILPFITSPYVARVIGAEGLGTYSFSYSVAYYFVLFSMLGLKNYGNRSIAKVRDNKVQMNMTFSGILFLHFIVSFICCILYGGYILILRENRLYALIQLGYVLSGLLDISWFYFGIEKFKLTVARNMLIKILNVVCIFVFVHEKEDLWKYCLIMSLGMFLSSLTLWLPLKRYVRIVKVEKNEIMVHLKPMLILFIPAIAVSLYKYMDKIMIGSLSDKAQLGFYDNAEKVTNIPMTIISSFGTVMLPKMSNLVAKKDISAVTKYMNLSIKYVMCLALALACGLAAVGKVFAPIFWGNEFELSGTLIMGLAITIPFISFANVIRTQYLIPNSKDKDYLVSVVAGAVINLIINFLLIPKLGAIGATVGTISAEVLVCLIQTYSVRNALPLFEYFRSFYIFIIFGFFMFGSVFFTGKILQANIFTLTIQVISGIMIYGFLSLFYFIKTKDKTVIDMFLKFKDIAFEKRNKR